MTGKSFCYFYTQPFLHNLRIIKHEALSFILTRFLNVINAVINAKHENSVNGKVRAFKNHLQNNSNRYYTYKYKGLQGKLKSLIKSQKESYYKRVPQKLSLVSTSSKYY